MDTLVLNIAYMPISRVSWKQAICWIVSGRAELVEGYEDRVIRSPSQAFPMPSVVRFLSKTVTFLTKGVRFSRNNVWLRDRGLCQYCGKEVCRSEFTYDHVLPRSQGGKTTWENIVVACHQCNQRKKNRTPKQARMKLQRAPFRPPFLPGLDSPVLSFREGMPPSWKDYLSSVTYWHGRLEEGS